MADITLTLTGEAPLVMHNARLSDPLDPYTKKLKECTSKRNKTESDHALIARTEFEGGIYHNDEGGPFVPGENILKCMVEGARLRKLGKEVERSLIVMKEANLLHYEGPRDIDGLWEGGFFYRKSVGVQKNRTMRTRPRWDDWWVSVPCVLDTTRLDLDALRLVVADAGQFIGLGERRPLFGRFLATVATR